MIVPTFWSCLAKEISATTASDLVTLRETVLMFPSVTTVVFRGIYVLPKLNTELPLSICVSWCFFNSLCRHIAAECTAESRCWNCREPGHVASNCSNEGICHSCGKSGHRARDCPNPDSRSGDFRLCNNCFKPGHLAADCTNEKACKNCRTSGHIARDCRNDPICNICSISGHVARHCPKGDSNYSDRGSRVRDGGMQRGGLSRVGRDRDGVGSIITCHNCGGRGHMAYECPSARVADRGFRRY